MALTPQQLEVIGALLDEHLLRAHSRGLIEGNSAAKQALHSVIREMEAKGSNAMEILCVIKNFVKGTPQEQTKPKA